ncbi:hypothetical protein F5H01DRAFT_385352 [Linnemannia elongata]|nr:hypothetical protein F5H01DRAFT_385475 [Linnemannia elongata]KAK5797015.1 hypothetical protein F5H01DRAFT_385352 [Linnemannia elongata]
MAETLKQLNQYPGQGGRPKVLIVGAGLAGLTLGMLLHKAGIPFEIYERAAVVKPLGSAMYFNCTTANLFKQCGIYDEFVSLRKYVSSIKMCNEVRVVDFSMDFAGHEALQVHDLLTRQIPKERIHYGAKVATTESNDNGVLIRFMDGSEVKGDILVGADGAYSTVRKGLYAKLKDEGKLPPSNDLPLPFTTVCVLAQTRPLTPEEFLDIAQEESQFRNFIATDKMYTWSTLTTAQNTVCWGSILFLDEESSKEDKSFSNSDWGQEAAMAMCEEVKNFPIIGEGDKKLTLKDLMDLTPSGHFSKVMLEEKVFETWYSGRTVLVGDACHKLNPAGGVGAANAIHDVIELANRINGLPFLSIVSDIEDAFKAYKSERIGWVTKAFENSKVFRTMVGQSTSSKITRFLVKHTPQWVMLRIERRQFTHRPQVAFLPLVEDRGYVKAAPQSSLAIKTPDETERSTIIQAV